MCKHDAEKLAISVLEVYEAVVAESEVQSDLASSFQRLDRFAP
jgi:hypothetical protein